jgi:uncharacterized protein YegP (UPF0339 family)
MEKIKNPKFEIKETKNEEYHFVLKAKNGRTILSSETYVSKQGAEGGIASIVNNSHSPTFEVKKSVDNQHYFILIAENGKTIGVSEMYTTKQGCTKGMQSVYENTLIIAHR